MTLQDVALLVVGYSLGGLTMMAVILLVTRARW